MKPRDFQHQNARLGGTDARSQVSAAVLGQAHHLRLAQRTNKIKAIIATPIAITLMTMGVWFIAQINWAFDDLLNWGVLDACGLVALMTCFALAKILRIAWQGDRIILTLSPEGYHTHLRTDRPIPWTDIAGARMSFGRVIRHCLVLHPEAPPGWIAQGVTINRDLPFRKGGVCTILNHVEVDTDQLDALFSGFLAVYGKHARD
ncbi:MAG: hypothetical protein ACK4NW_07305 [Roseinatronobacter sp.]